MYQKIGLKMATSYSPNFNTPKRLRKKIKFIIIHYTGMKKETDAIKRLCNSKSKVSCHYFIKNNGQIINLVPDLYTSWHAGVSNWRNFKSLNKYSLGIEINNPGHNHKYKNFKSRQIKSLVKLLRYLIKSYNIKKENILGHSDISPDRKKDPGEKFPWKKLAKYNLCKWHNFDENKIKKFRNLGLNDNEKKIFFNNLYKIGYSKLKSKGHKTKKINLIKAFQRKFRQGLITSKIDKECFLISENLVKS